MVSGGVQFVRTHSKKKKKEINIILLTVELKLVVNRKYLKCHVFKTKALFGKSFFYKKKIT